MRLSGFGLTGLFGTLLITACGTNYDLPDIGAQELAAASAVMRQESVASNVSANTNAEQAVEWFRSASLRIEPVAEKLCRAELKTASSLYCDFKISLLTGERLAPNAYQTRADNDQPLIFVTTSFLDDIRNEDEIAFVLGHEAGHHIAEHINKKRDQQVAGAIAMGVLAAVIVGAANAYGGYQTPYQQAQDRQLVLNAATVGGVLGGQSYSQTYELEADMIGALIADQAGYDPEKGARVFARLGQPHREGQVPVLDGQAAFWSTHPKSPERIAMVMQTRQRIELAEQLGVNPIEAVKDEDAIRKARARPQAAAGIPAQPVPVTAEEPAPAAEAAPASQARAAAFPPIAGPRPYEGTPLKNFTPEQIEGYCDQDWLTQVEESGRSIYNPCRMPEAFS